jgi:ABC-type transport system involved in multi-copper enzyme maturation permease subunit
MSSIESKEKQADWRSLSPARFLTVMQADLAHLIRRPLFWIWVSIIILSALGMSTGSMRIQSGDTSVGGTKAWVTSEFAIAQQLSMLSLLFYAFFLAIIAGMSFIQDSEWRVDELLHATPLKPAEYVWGKFAAVLTAAFAVLAIHLLAMVFFFHFWPTTAEIGIRGPFQLGNYVRPALVFSAPMIVFIAGTSLAIGELTRKPILVFLLPLMMLLVSVFFLWDWSPGWLSPAVNRSLMLLDPGGFRWLQERWLKVDRGVAFYNTAPIPFDAGFLTSRLVLGLIGLAAVALCVRHCAGSFAGRLVAASRSGLGALQAAQASDHDQGNHTTKPLLPRSTRLDALGMTSHDPGFIEGAFHVARIEISELICSPGLYLFVPLILLQILGTSLARLGYLDSPLLITPGTFAVGAMTQLSAFVGLLLLWYSVESLERERSTRLAAISDPAPIYTGSLLLGKAAALAVMGLAIVLATIVAGLIAILIQGKVSFRLGPIALVWGLLLFPTLVLWTSFVFAVHSITRNRYTTYAVGLAVLSFTGYKVAVNEINWVGNWPLWDAVRWSDLSVLEFDRLAIILSRVLALGLAFFFLALTVRFFPRRDTDSVRILHQLRPRELLASGLRLVPWALLPLITGIWLALEVARGYQGWTARNDAKNHWRKNLATYHDAPVPDLTHVDLEVDLFPDAGRFSVSGSYDLVNPSEAALHDMLLTSGLRWQAISWTLDGKPYVPEDRARLQVFRLGKPLKQGGTAQIGFRYVGTYPGGVSRRGGATNEFVLPSGVVLTSFGPSFVPMLGYSDQIGVDDENRAESREYAEGFFEGSTPSMLGARAPFSTRIKLSGPADFTLNSVGVKRLDRIDGERRTVIWESDHPVSFFNIVAGRLVEEKGKGTAVYYHPKHTYNREEMLSSLNGAREYFSQWFFPYPWKELKLTEFPDMASYAQGFPTNISFSEGVGFLAADSAESHFAFEVTAHEAAHQWWGTIVVPGKGPGGNILAEGTANFSTILLVEQIKGPYARMEFCKRLEASYANSRHADAERPLVRIDGSREGDNSVTYDKGAWVFWMLINEMGGERALQGLQSFFKIYHGNSDHPVLQDFLVEMRKFALDPASFDRFTRAWFYEVVLPEYRLRDATRTRDGNGWKVAVRMENAGTGEMPVEVAATRGERFNKAGAALAEYRETRVVATVAAGQSSELTIFCPFEPEAVVVDPDAKVLQLERKTATTRL